jgi:hypothetical protein
LTILQLLRYGHGQTPETWAAAVERSAALQKHGSGKGGWNESKVTKDTCGVA